MKSFLDQNQLLHLLKHAGHRHSGVQVIFLKWVVIERPFNFFFFHSGSFSQISLYFFCSVHSPSSEFLAFAFKSAVRNEMREGEKKKKKATDDQSRMNKGTKRYKRVLNSSRSVEKPTVVTRFHLLISMFLIFGCLFNAIISYSERKSISYHNRVCARV